MVFITKSYQDLFGVRSYINAENKYSKSDESQINIWTFSTYDGKNCHRIHLSNFLKQESEINY